MNMTATNNNQRPTPRHFPWRSIFRLAMAHGVPPEQVWRMTPVELMALMPETDGDMMTQSRLEALMARYPDKPVLSQ